MTEVNNDMPEPQITNEALRANYQANTKKGKESKRPGAVPEERKAGEKVITGKVVSVEKSLGRKIKDTFIGENMHNVWNFVLHDVLVPSAKGMIVDAMSKGTERAFYGDMRRSNTGGSRGGHVPYDRYSSKPEPRQNMSLRARASHDFNEIVLNTRVDAEIVLDRLGDLLDEYQQVSVADLYDAVGITGDFTDARWGWTDLRGARVVSTRNGYLLDMPRTVTIA